MVETLQQGNSQVFPGTVKLQRAQGGFGIKRSNRRTHSYQGASDIGERWGLGEEEASPLCLVKISGTLGWERGRESSAQAQREEAWVPAPTGPRHHARGSSREPSLQPRQGSYARFIEKALGGWPQEGKSDLFKFIQSRFKCSFLTPELMLSPLG